MKEERDEESSDRHQGILGNEQADREAKKAVEGNKTDIYRLILLHKPLSISKAAIIMRHKKEWWTSTEQHLSQLLRFKKTKAIDSNWHNAAKIITTLAELSYKHASLLV